MFLFLVKKNQHITTLLRTTVHSSFYKTRLQAIYPAQLKLPSRF